MPEGYALKYHGPEIKGMVMSMPEKREILTRIDKSEVKSIETKADGSIVVTDKAGNMKVIGKDNEGDPADILKQLDY